MQQEKLIEIATLEVDCKIGKDRHFIAADRKNRLRIALGLFSVVGSAIMASAIGPAMGRLARDYFNSFNYIDDFIKVVAAVLPLLVGISTAVIGFLGLEKQTAQHRYVGNAYIEIARKARSLINNINSDPNSEVAENLLAEYEKLLSKYLEINKEGESCPTNKKDSNKAMAMNGKRKAAIKEQLLAFDSTTLGLAEKKSAPKMQVSWLVKRAAKYRLACVLRFFRVIRKTDFRKFLRSL